MHIFHGLYIKWGFVQVFHRMHMVFGILFLLFALMHDIKLWTYTVPGENIF